MKFFCNFTSGKKKGARIVRSWICVMIISAITTLTLFDGIDSNAAVIGQEKTEQGTDLNTVVNLYSDDSMMPAGPAETTEMTQAAEAAEPTKATETAEPAKATEATEPTKATEATEATEPTKATEATEAAEPTKATEPKPVQASVKLKNNKDARISWKKVKGDVSYEVQRSKQKNGTYKKIASCSGSTRKYIDESVKRGNYYYYRVIAITKNGVKRKSAKLTFGCPISQVSDIKLTRYSTTSVKVSWKPAKQATYYKVYCAKTKSGKYQRVATTKQSWYRVKNLNNNQTYYFQVKACAAKNSSKLDSAASAGGSMKMRTYERTTIFAGDSITTGLTAYGTLGQIDIGGRKDVVAAIGLNTITFRTRREFSGYSALGKVAASQPYRAYIMLGTNEIHYRSSDDVIAGYREIVQALKADAPDTDVVLLAVPPVTWSKQQQSSGFAQIPSLNQKIKTMAAELGVRYYDYTGFLKDANGCLQSGYSAGDGIHWTAAAYQLFAKQITQYDKSLD